MAYSVGQLYPIYTAPITLYYASDRAARRDTRQSAFVNQTGNYRITSVMWTDANGNWYQTQPSSGGIPIYAIRDLSDSYGLGWIRDDENIKASTMMANSFTVGQTCIITISRQNTSMTHTLQIYSGSNLLRTSNNVGDSYSLSLNSTEIQTLYKDNPNTNSGMITVKLTTYLNGQQVGTHNQTNIMVYFPTAEKPKFTTNPTVTIINPVNGKAIAWQSSLKITSGTATAGSGATITGYKAFVEGYSSDVFPYTTPTINKTGNVVVKVIATDSRGNQAEYSQTIVFTTYFASGISDFIALRITADGVSFSATGTYDSTFNAPTFKVLAYEKGVYPETWVDKLSGSTFKATTNQWAVEGSLSGFERTKTYYLKIIVTDSMGNISESKILVASENVPLSMGRHGSGVGVLFDNFKEENLQVGSGGIYSNGKITVQTDKENYYGLSIINNTDDIKPGLIGFTDKDGPQAVIGWSNQFKSLILQVIKSGKALFITEDNVYYDDIPLKSIDETGSNHIKYTGGVLEQWGKSTSTTAQSKITFPIAFIDSPVITIQVQTSSVWHRVTQNVTGCTSTDFSYSAFNSSDGSALGTFTVHWRAIGRWK